jgi:hypothetical protein
VLKLKGLARDNFGQKQAKHGVGSELRIPKGLGAEYAAARKITPA